MTPPGSATWPARVRLAVVACAVALLAVACSSSSTTSTPPAASPSVSAASSTLCADAAALRASLDKLTKIQASAGQGAVNEVKADLANVKTAATTFANAAKGKWHSQTSALKSGLTSLETAVQKLAANPSTTAVSGVVSALGQVTTAAQQLFTEVGKDCPSGT